MSLVVFFFTLRHPKGGSFVRPAKVSFGVDYLAAVQQVYQVDLEEVVSEEISTSSKKLKWLAVEERRYDAPRHTVRSEEVRCAAPRRQNAKLVKMELKPESDSLTSDLLYSIIYI